MIAAFLLIGCVFFAIRIILLIPGDTPGEGSGDL